MLTDGLGPTTIRLQAPDLPGAALRAGQSFRAVVQGSPGQLSLTVAGGRVPLEGATGLLPGQAVQVEVTSSQGSLQLRVSPLPPESGGGATSTQHMAAAVLRSLGLVEPPGTGARFVPAALPENQEALRQILALFIEHSNTSGALREVTSMLQQAAAEGVLESAVAGRVTALLAQFGAGDAKSFRDLLQRAGDGRSIEGRLAALAKGSPLDTILASLRSEVAFELAHLRGQAGLIAYLRAKRQLQKFESAVERILNRDTSSQLQNLRSLEHPYLFLDLPVSEENGFHHGLIHFFHEGQGKGKRFDPHNATVVLDLSMTKLGDLWIRVDIRQGRCRCEFRATTPQVEEALDQAAPDLRTALADAGYPAAEVRVSTWDGNRLRETGQLLARFASVNVQA